MSVTKLISVREIYKPTVQYFEGQQAIYEHLGDSNRVNYYKGVLHGMKLVIDGCMVRSDREGAE